jgi:pilus assembly protein CpaE
VSATAGIIGGSYKQLESWLRAAGVQASLLNVEDLAGSSAGTTPSPDLLLVDIRDQRSLLAQIPNLKRRHPAMSIAIICSSLDPELMLEAMRAGVNECVPEPVTQAAVEAAVGRLLEQSRPSEGRVHAIVGAKGGVGTTTIAANLAQALAQSSGNVLLIDLNISSGDVATFFGVEPRFTVSEALENTHRLDQTFLQSVVVSAGANLDLLASSTRSNGAATVVDTEHVRTLLAFATRCYRNVVVDVPRLEAPMIDALDAAASIFVVVNHELPTIRNAQNLMMKLRRRYEADRIRLLVNRSDRQSEIGPEDIQKALNARIAHTFPSDYRQAVDAVNKGRPLALSTRGRLGTAFHAFAATVGRTKEPAAPRSVAAAEPGRLFGWMMPTRSAER